MFAVVILNISKKKLVIPLKWVYSFDIIQSLNYGISHTKNHLFFYSKDSTIEPNFRCAIKTAFDEENNSCYYGKILYVFGKFFL